jgi:GTP-binding protein YchF
MKIGIIGGPSSGKTSLFCGLSGIAYEAALSAQASGKPRGAPVKVYDPRIDAIGDIIKQPKRVFATLDFEDSPPLGFDATTRDGNRQTLHAYRLCDGLVHVVDAYQLKPEEVMARIDTIKMELAVADLDIVEKRMEKLESQLRKPVPTREQDKHELEVLTHVRAHLDKGVLSYPPGLTAEDARVLQAYRFFVQKPVLTVLNVAEDQAAEPAPPEAVLKHDPAAIALSAKLELELSRCSGAERQEFMSCYGLKGLSAGRVVDRCFKMLGLSVFFTAGDKDVRAWVISEGDNAVTAAGKIHADIERGFISAEIVSYEHWLAAAGSMKDIKAKGQFRLEGKTYQVRDGDIMNVRFHV